MLSRRAFLRIVVVGGAATLAAVPSLTEALTLLDGHASPVTADYEIRLFGSLQVEAAGERLPPLDSPAALRVLAMAALRPERLGYPRRVGAMLRPNATGRAPVAEQALAELQGWAGPSLVQVDGTVARLNPDRLILVDVDLWNQLLDRATGPRRLEILQMAIRLYRGPLLRGFSGQFTLDQRSQYRLEFAAVAREVATAVRESDPERAEVLARRSQFALANEWAARAAARRRERNKVTPTPV